MTTRKEPMGNSHEAQCAASDPACTASQFLPAWRQALLAALAEAAEVIRYDLPKAETCINGRGCDHCTRAAAALVAADRVLVACQSSRKEPSILLITKDQAEQALAHAALVGIEVGQGNRALAAEAHAKARQLLGLDPLKKDEKNDA